MTDLKDLVGRRIQHVTTSWHRHPDARPSLLHMWLHIENLGPIRLPTAVSGALELAAQQPHDPYDMDEYGHVTVEDAPAGSLLSSLVGQRIDGGANVYDATVGTPIVAAIGIVLRFPTGGVRILNIADELVIASDQAPGTTEIDVRSRQLRPPGSPPRTAS